MREICGQVWCGILRPTTYGSWTLLRENSWRGLPTNIGEGRTGFLQWWPCPHEEAGLPLFCCEHSEMSVSHTTETQPKQALGSPGTRW